MARPNIHEINMRKKLIKILAGVISKNVVPIPALSLKEYSKQMAEYAFDHLDIFDPYKMAYNLQQKKGVEWQGKVLKSRYAASEEDILNSLIYCDLLNYFDVPQIMNRETVMWVAKEDIKPSYKEGDLIGYKGTFVPVLSVNEEIAEYTVLYEGEEIKIPVEVLERD